MSSRTLKKLQNKENLRSNSAEHTDSEDSGSDADNGSNVKSFNAFDLLGGEEDGDDESEEERSDVDNAALESESALKEGVNNIKGGNDSHSSEMSREESVEPTNDSVGNTAQSDTLEGSDIPEDEREVKPKQKKKSKSKSKSKSKAKTKGKGKSASSKLNLDDIKEDELDKVLSELGSHAPKDDENAFGVQSSNFEKELEEEDVPVSDFDSNFKYYTSGRMKSLLPLLYVKTIKELDPDQELRNLFGKLSSDTIDDANTTTAMAIQPEILAQFRKIAKLTRGWCGKDRRSLPGTTRKLLLTRIKDDYLPTSQKPMNMEELSFDEILKIHEYKEDSATIDELREVVDSELKLGVKYFKFLKVSTIQERLANTKFYASVVMMADPDSLIQLLQHYPYHAETLLQVSMIMLRQGGDKSVANALIEKCLFVFDRSFNMKFHELLSNGKLSLIRLPYECFLNRQFYLCLFRYITSLGERSMFSTAFAYCKFLLSLSPAEDPLGVRYFLDFYAMMNDDYHFLTGFCESPLVTTYKKWLTPGLAFSCALAHFNLDKIELAKEKLAVAFENFPYVSFKLLEQVCKVDTLPVLEKDLEITDEDRLAGESYLVRAKFLWNNQAKLSFLEEELISLFKSKSSKRANYSGLSSVYSLFFGLKPDTPSLELPLNLIRFAVLSGENTMMARIPKKVWNTQELLEYDILPPKDNTVEYNEFSGVQNSNKKATDSLLNYVDQNILGSIIQNQTENSFEMAELEEQLNQLQAEEPDQEQ